MSGVNEKASLIEKRIDSMGDLYRNWKLPKKLDGCITVGELVDKGCTICKKPLYPEGSTGFGSLWCPDHECVWLFIPSAKLARYGHVSKNWVNLLTGESSKYYKEWKKRHS